VEVAQDAVPLPVRSDREAFAPVDWGLFATMGLVWGSSFLFIKIGLETFHPGLVTWARVALGALALAPFPQAWRRFDREDRGRVLVLSVVWVGIPFTLFPLAEQHITSAVTGLLNGAVPLFTGVIGALFFQRRPRGPQRWGIGVGFAGVALISLGAGARGGSAAAGVLMVLLATACYGVATNLAGPVQQKYGSVAVMARMLALASVWTAPFGLLGIPQSSVAAGPVAAVAVLGVVGTGLAFVTMATLVGRVGGPRASFITYLIPVVSLVLGAAFLAERVAAVGLVGVMLVVAGAVLAARREA
jgi:drug/metabolite transporter (DMT)-like permease